MPSSVVFVYGTLCRGRSNARLLRRAEFLGDAHVSGFRLWSHPSAGFPCVRAGDGTVRGEAYRVSAAELRALDELEGTDGPRPLYVRTSVPVHVGPRVLLGFLYQWPRDPSADGWRAHPADRWEPSALVRTPRR